MASILQIPQGSSTTSTFNSGIPLLDVIKSHPIGLIFLDPGVGFTAGQLASNTAFLAELAIKTRAPRGSRAYPFWRLTNYEYKGKEPTKAALGNLTNGEITTSDGIPAFGFQHRIGEIFHQKLMEAQNAGLTIMIVDKNYVVYGTIDGSIWRGYSIADFYVGLSQYGNFSTASLYPFDITLDSMLEYKENCRFVQSTSALVAKTGIRDVVLSEFSLAGNVIKVGLTALGGKNLTDLYATELLQAGVWIVTNVTTGLTATVTPTFDSTNKVITLTLSGTPWTTAVSNDPFTANLAASSVLAALTTPIDGYESTGALAFLKP